MPRCLLVCLLFLLACRPAPEPVWRVGLIGVFDGSSRRSSGEPARDGATLAVAQLNAAGGVVINGVAHRVVLIDRETAPRPDAAASVARELVNLDSVDVLVGPQYSYLAEAAGGVAEAAEVPLIAPMASAAPVTAGRSFVTRLAFLDAVQGRVLAGFIVDTLRIGRVAAMHSASSMYGRDIVALFAREFAARGGRMVRVATYDEDDPRSRSTALRRLVESNPEALLLPNLTYRDSQDIRVLREQGFRGRLVGSDSWDPTALTNRADVDGTVVAANWDRRSDVPEARAFIDAFTAANPGRLPSATTAATYDAVRILAAAAVRSGKRSGRPVADAVRNAGAYRGAFGAYRFVGTGDPIRSAAVLELFADSAILRAIVEPSP